jgi:type I restriction enzyme S subunit
MDDWKVVPIGDVAEIFDGPHATPKTIDSGPIFLGIGALENGRINLGETRHVTPADFATWTRRVKPRPRDVVFSYETRLGQVAMIPDNFECCLGRRMGLVRVNQNKLDPHFFLYSYLSPQFQEFLRSRTIPGATVDRLPLKDFPSFPISLPPMDIQRSIASLLSSIDDKIELNRRMNETLEAMAQAIFRDWFVDFGPVRRKLEGTTDPVAIMGGLTPDPARAAELAGLFPDGFGTDDAPEGWRLMSLSDVADQYKGTVNPQTLPGELFEHYSLPAHDTGQAPARDLGIDIKSNKVPVPSGAILVSKLNPETLRVWAPTEYAGLPQVASTEFLVFTPKKSAGRGLLYFLFRDPIVRQIMEGMVTGTSKSHQRISPPALLQTKLVVGEGLAFAAFEALAEPMLRRSLALRAENRALAETRDYLLPRLMSGEVRVGELGAQTRSEIAA